MLWSLLKVALFLAAVAGLTFGAAMLSDSGEAIRIVALGQEFNLGALQAAILITIIVVVLWVVFKIVGFVVAFLRFVTGDETAISRYFDRSRERKGYQALAEGMLAIASGESRLAMSRAAKAERYLRRPDLTNLLTAQAAEMNGDTRRAEQVYRRMLNDQRTRFVGIRGLLSQKLGDGDTDTALKLAQKAFALNPKHPEVQNTLFKLQTESGDWKGARDVLLAKMRQGEIPKDVHKRRDAVLALQEAKVVLDQNASIEAREAAIAANKSSPDLIPAAAMAAKAYADQGNVKSATRVLLKAWEAQPHPDLAGVFASLVPSESAVERLARFEKLLSLRPDHEETKLLRAELCIAAEDFPGARRALGNLAETNPTARTLTLMAAIERGEGESEDVVRGWLARAVTAPRGKQWCCDKCQNIQAEWGPVCDNCGGFDTLSWREPTSGGIPLPNGAEMLPLIVGAGKPKAEEAFDITPDATAEGEK
ncbi:HemY protein [Rhodobacter aestuarii]|uniref:HemY protein n=1 Tax=Rhodobacter aestuarii TaxID=453582 RepID=A0A1N7LLD9_9RHOB|nr:MULTISPECIES: heme biosynthesis HemY N-terminal domain-containing protein [Rhodobacter]PTV95177.1 HemY protein [Rhodobacter aestuarii]SIS74650.1 HemY protein [Rhodobacter aestuarii]SOC07726.1 HemY protein [Rhodobacter sp. JA431]